MATDKAPGGSENVNEKDGSLNQCTKNDLESKVEDTVMKTKVDAMWDQLNKGVSKDALRRFSSKSPSTVNKNEPKPKTSNNWMKYLQVKPSNGEGPKRSRDGTSEGGKKVDAQSEGHSSNSWMANLGLSANKTGSLGKDKQEKVPSIAQNDITDEAKKIAAAALSAVKDAAAAASNRGKTVITEVREFAGKEIEIKRRIDAEAKEASEKAKASAPSAVDAVLDQIKKKPKLSVLDKTKKDWGEFKEENLGLEDELETYKKSSNQYLDRVGFLQRTDLREYERERDARLAVQARRRPDMRED